MLLEQDFNFRLPLFSHKSPVRYVKLNAASDYHTKRNLVEINIKDAEGAVCSYNYRNGRLKARRSPTAE